MSKGNENPVPVKGETLKSKESLYFPSVKGQEWSSVDPDVRWGLENILNHVFPEDYQERSYEYALSLMRFLLDNPRGIDKKMLSKFLDEKDIPESTAYNVVIPKLVRFGLLERRREANESNPGKGWFMVLKPSISFSSHLSKLAKEWRSMYKTAKNKD